MGWLLAAVLSAVTAGTPVAEPRVLQRYDSSIRSDTSALTLYVDNSFKYESRGDSCWLWHDRTGTWSKQGEVLTLTYSSPVDDSRDGVMVQGTFSDSSRILVLVTDPVGAPLPDVLVTFNGHGYESPTGADGRAFVDYEDIPEAQGYGWCKSKILTQLIVKVGDRTSSYSLEKELANYFEVVLDLAPTSHTEIHTTGYKMQGQGLTLVTPADSGETGAVYGIWVGKLKATDDRKRPAT